MNDFYANLAFSSIFYMLSTGIVKNGVHLMSCIKSIQMKLDREITLYIQMLCRESFLMMK